MLTWGGWIVTPFKSTPFVLRLEAATHVVPTRSQIPVFQISNNFFFSMSICPSGPLLWSSGQSSWSQIRKSRFDSRRYQIFWEVVGLERGPLSLVSTTEEPLGRKSSGCSLENRENGRRDSSRWSRANVYLQKLALTSPTSGGRSVGIVRSWTQTTEFSLVCPSVLNTKPEEHYICTHLQSVITKLRKVEGPEIIHSAFPSDLKCVERTSVSGLHS
jgi:hypothetical protein